MIRRLLLLWHRAKTRGKMDRVFSRGEDPYGYARSPYETARLAAMREETDKLRQVTEGTRNDALNRAAFAIGQLVGGGELPRDLVERDLIDAGRAIGLDENEVMATVKSGLDAGEKEPRRAPAGKPKASPA